MILVLLCGGAGTRFNHTYPKPLNLVHGIPMIYHVITKLNVSDLTIIYNKLLDEFGFSGYLINTFPNIRFEFITVDYQTRGAAETLYLGLSKISTDRYHEQVVVFDNDNIYEGLNIYDLPRGNFVLYTKNNTKLTHYSFITFENNTLIDIQERTPISDYICMGCYGFQSVKTCLIYCKKIVMETNTDEPYLSKVIKLLLLNRLEVAVYHLPSVYSIGTPKDVIMNISKLTHVPLRAVFDLDNTLVSYPSVYKNYNTVNTIKHTSELIKFLKQHGHYVILYTARKMLSCNSNVGKIMKNIAKITLDSLEKLGIEYDEIHFGKPYGDFYIDDKAFNTFDINLTEQLGFYDFNNSFLSVDNKANKYNRITRIDKHKISKTGPCLLGEIFYYTMVRNYSELHPFFPKFYSHEADTQIILEYINGTSISKIYCEGLFQSSLLLELLNTLHTIHSFTHINDNVTITEVDMYHHYIDKFENRSLNHSNYPFVDFEHIYTIIKEQLVEFLNKSFPVHPIIHGDPWFSNIMYYKNRFIFYDMRGLINNKQTIKGHVLYDYAKIYQSIIGLDCIIMYDSFINDHIRDTAEDVFWNFLFDNNIITPEDSIYLKRLTGYLIYNTFNFYEEDFEVSKKNKIWELVKECIGVTY